MAWALVQLPAGLGQSGGSGNQWNLQVVKFYQPSLKEARRVPFSLPPDTVTAEAIRTEYDSTMPPAPPAELADSLPAVPSPRISRERLAPLPRFSALAEGGNYATFGLDVAANTTYHADYLSAVRFQHRSGHYGTRASRFSRQMLTAGDERFFSRRKWILHQKFHFMRAAHRLYGLGIAEQLPSPRQDDYRKTQWFARWAPTLTKVRFRTLPFSLAPAVQFFSVNHMREWSAQFEGIVYDTFAGRHKVSLHTATEIYWLRLGADSSTQRMRYQITPAYSLSHRLGRLQAGFSAASSHEKKFYFFPLLHIEFYAAPEKITLLGGLDGRILPFDAAAAWQENPYLGDSLPLRFPVETFRIFAGLRMTPLPGLYWTARIISSQMRHAPYYVLDTAALPAMTIRYLTTNFLTFQTDLLYRREAWAGLEGGLRFQFNGYQQVSGQEPPWHLPRYKGQGWVRIRPFHKKVGVGVAFDWVGPRPALDSTGTAITLPAYFLPHVKLQYHYNEMIAAHVLLENVTNAAYERWYGYAGRRFTVSGGISVRF